MKRLARIAIAVVVIMVIGYFKHHQEASQTLSEARKGFVTKLTENLQEGRPAPKPPEGVFDLVKYHSPAGDLAAYVTPDPKDGKKHPIVIWLVGGFESSIDENFWTQASPDNDQSAAAYRLAGIPMMFPSLRGGNDNPGNKEGFYGEVDDVLAATEYAANLPWVDSSRIYLGGHSTGGTLVLLTSEMAEEGLYRAVISFGPVDSVAGYGQDQLPFNVRDEKESRLRNPSAFLHSVTNRTLVIEGDTDTSNLPALNKLRRASHNPLISFTEATGYSHFTVLASANAALAQKILADSGPGASTLSLTSREIDAAKKEAAESSALPSGSVLQTTARTAVIFYTAPGAPDPVAAAREALGRHLPELPVLTNMKDAKRPPFAVIREEKAPFDENSLPDASYFKFGGRGMDDNDVAAIAKSDRSIELIIVARSDSAWKTMKLFNECVADCAEKTGAYVNDMPTREFFTKEAWREDRVEGWGPAEIPDLATQVNLHNYRESKDSAYTRLVTLGMAKFGLPDVAVDRCAPGQAKLAAGLMRVVCQALALQPQVNDPGNYTLDLARLQPAEVREAYQELMLPGGQAKATISLLRGEPREGDENNDLVSLGFSHSQGESDEVRMAELLVRFWGKKDPLISISHNDELNKLSGQAREKLLAMAPQFAHGIPVGTHLMVKGPFDRDDEAGEKEWMWVDVTEWQEGQPIRGLLQNDPYYIKSLHRGSTVTIDPNKAFDYLLVHPDGTEEGNETDKLLEKQQQEQEQKR